jgi:mannose-1-phosphate guanylyltransferase/mannose-6-phosphate isomerase
MPKCIVTIISGGSGSRLWPLSRDNHPKPFIRLSDGQSLLQKAFLRGINLPCATEVLTVTNRELIFLTIDHFDEIKSAIDKRYILEPEGRSTAAAIAAAAIDIQKRHGDEALMLVLPADHIVKNQKAFSAAVDEAIRLANEDKLVTFGIKPTSPDTSYGYIEADHNKVLRFVEKPDLEKAKAYLTQGNFYWNSGMFCFKVSLLLDEMRQHCPDILEATIKTINASARDEVLGFPSLNLKAELFNEVPSNSIDYALLEKSDKVAIVSCVIGWSDVGSWNAFTELMPADVNGNRKQGEVIFHNTKNVSVFSEKRLVSVIGMEDVIVVDTMDAILIVHKDHTQEVKTIYTQLKNNKNEMHKLHREVHRPWGTYTVLEDEPEFKVKKIIVKPSGKLSLQSHQHRAEHWVVVKGEATIMNDGIEIKLQENQSTYIEKGHKHQLMNLTQNPLEIIEVQSGAYLGEDDIVRYDDHYGRIERK